MRKLDCVLIYSVCFTISVSHVTINNLIAGGYAAGIVSSANSSSAPFTTNPLNDSIDCDYSSYPDFCIPPSPPNLNCDDVDGKDFTVFPPDPHIFDRDKDGEGCESSE